jgi:NDP-sugar pyrophosphorylase family protein
MKAMILAAGLGTRLRPLTNDRPKALVEIGGRTLLEIALLRLKKFGVGEVIVNAHHFSDEVAKFLGERDFGMRIEISREPDLLDTGGGLKRAAWFFLDDRATSDEPFILHNVDVLSTIDLGRMLRFHNEHTSLATLAVQDRETSRYLLFDEHMHLCGRRVGRDGEIEVALTSVEKRQLAFCGVHVISPRIFERMTEDGAFSIVPAYLRLASEGENIFGFRADEYYWLDLGRPESLVRAERDVASGLIR